MRSAFIRSELSYPAMLLAEQLVHQRFVHPGPLVLGTAPFKIPSPTVDRDRQFVTSLLSRGINLRKYILRRSNISIGFCMLPRSSDYIFIQSRIFLHWLEPGV